MLAEGAITSSLAGGRRWVLWGVSLLAVAPLSTLAAAGLAATVGCSPVVVTGGAVAASPAPTVLAEGPEPPRGGLPMPALALDWQPPSAVAGDVEALASALAAHSRVALLVDGGADAGVGGGGIDSMRLAALVGRLAPHTAARPIAGAAAGGPRIADVLREDPPLVPQPVAGGRTRWGVPGALEFDRRQLEAWADLGDPAVLLLGPVGVDSPAWRELATGAVGSCEPLFDALLDGQTRSLAELEPFLDHADALLEAVYLERLAAVVPGLTEELAGVAEPEPGRAARKLDGPGRARQQCGRAYLEYLRPFAACLETDAADGGPSQCASAPRLFLQGAARIGSVEPSVYVPHDCARQLGRDYVEALRAPARDAAELVADALDVHWMALVDRLATLSEIHAALDQLCEPARRRFTPPDLAALREQVAALGPLFNRAEAPAPDARFLANDGAFHVPGIGRVRQLAHYDGGTGSAARSLREAAAGLARFERAHARCVARPGEPPLMAMLVGTATAQTEFLGFFYAEELWCGELGPI